MTDALLADLRALVEEWQARYGPIPGGFQHSLTIHEVTGHLCGLIAKHAPKSDASERDELARVLATQGLYCGDHDDLPAMGECVACDRDRHVWADAILAAGWRRR